MILDMTKKCYVKDIKKPMDILFLGLKVIERNE